MSTTTQSPIPWRTATVLSLVWGFAVTIINMIVWILSIGPGPLHPLFLGVPTGLAIVISGLAHQSARVAVMTGAIAMAFAAIVLGLLVGLSVTLIHWRN